MWVDIGVLIHLFIHEIICDILYYLWCANKLNSIQPCLYMKRKKTEMKASF